MPKDGYSNVVFEYTEGGLTGCRFIVEYLPEEIEEAKAKSQEPDSNMKIVATGISDKAAENMCLQALDSVLERQDDELARGLQTLLSLLEEADL